MPGAWWCGKDNWLVSLISIILDSVNDMQQVLLGRTQNVYAVNASIKIKIESF